MPLKKIIAGVGEVDMTPAEEAEHLASLVVPLPRRKQELRQRIAERARQEMDEFNLLEQTNPVARAAQVRARGRQLWQQVQAANSEAELNAIDINQGWT